MQDKSETEIQKALLEACRKGREQAIELSIRTGIPLIFAEDGVIKKVKPQYKYIRVPIDFDEKTLAT